MGLTILTGLVGSHAYGLNHEGSDRDYLSVYVAPMDSILGLHSRAEQDSTVISTDPDHTSHELEKFCRLALKGNPTVNELLWLDRYTWQTFDGQILVEMREGFLSAKTVSAYRGYITGQIHKLTLQDGTPTARFPKASKHVLRLCVQLVDLVAEGRITPRLAPEAVQLINEAVADAVEADRPDYIEVVARNMLNRIDAELTAHPLVARPEPEFDRINQLVIDIRRQIA